MFLTRWRLACGLCTIAVSLAILSMDIGGSAADPEPKRQRQGTLPEYIDGDQLIAESEIFIPDGATVHVRHGATVRFETRRIYSDGHGTIDGTGDQGLSGSPGASKGEWCTHNKGDLDRAGNDCSQNANHPDRGGPGTQGGKGGKGATVILAGNPTIEHVSIIVAGGPGGNGGSGGVGRFLYYCDQHYCNGCTKQCPNGAQGSAGETGESGHIVREK